MAVQSKKIDFNANSNKVTFTGNVGATDLQLTYSDGTTYDPTFTKIEAVVNFSGSNVTFGGYTFAPGNWNFSQQGGLVIPVQSGAISGSANCLITLRA